MPTRLPLLLVFLLLSGLLLASGTAHAAPSSLSATLAPEETFEFEEEDEGEGEEEETECETAELEVEEGELTQGEADEICEEEAEEAKKKAKKSGAGAPAPEECILRSAHGQASLISHGDKLKLTIGYTAYEPITAKLQIGHLATLHRHLGRSGVLRLIEDPQGSVPHRLVLDIKLPSARSTACPFRRLVLFPR